MKTSKQVEQELEEEKARYEFLKNRKVELEKELKEIEQELQPYLINTVGIVRVDFHNTDTLARVRLNCMGTIEALNWQGIHLIEGLEIRMYQDDRNIEIPGIVQRNQEENIWVAKVDWLKVVTENSISI